MRAVVAAAAEETFGRPQTKLFKDLIKSAGDSIRFLEIPFPLKSLFRDVVVSDVSRRCSSCAL